MEENKPTILNIEKRMRQLVLGINAMVSLSECLDLKNKESGPLSEFLEALDVDLEARFIEELTSAGIIGEA